MSKETCTCEKKREKRRIDVQRDLHKSLLKRDLFWHSQGSYLYSHIHTYTHTSCFLPSCRSCWWWCAVVTCGCGAHGCACAAFFLVCTCSGWWWAHGHMTHYGPNGHSLVTNNESSPCPPPLFVQCNAHSLSFFATHTSLFLSLALSLSLSLSPSLCVSLSYTHIYIHQRPLC